MKLAIIFAVVFTILFCGVLYCQSEKKEIKVFADMTDIPYGDKTKNVILKGSVRILHNDITVKSEYVEYNKDKNLATSPGKVYVTAPEADIESDKGIGDFKNRTVKAQNNVLATIRRSFTEEIKDRDKREDVRKEITEDVRVKADYGEYNYRDKLLTAKGNVVITEKDRVIIADQVTYNVREEIFTLTGNVRGTDTEGQTFASPGPVTVSIKDGNEYVKAPNAGISFFVEDEE